MKKFLRVGWIGFLLACPFALHAQASGISFAVVDSLPLRARHIFADAMGNLYWIDARGVFFKKDVHTDSLYQYAQWGAGIPEQADVSNPLRILLFYPGTGRIYFLSRWLTPLLVLDLKAHGILQPAAVGLSYDNQLWVYDLQDGLLKKITPEGNLLLQSAPFSQLMHQLPQPVRILDRHHEVYLYDPRQGIVICDELANVKATIPIPHSTSFTAAEGQLYVLKADSIYLFSPPFWQEIGMRLPAHLHPVDIAPGANSGTTVEAAGSFLFLLTPKMLYTLQVSGRSNN